MPSLLEMLHKTIDRHDIHITRLFYDNAKAAKKGILPVWVAG
jgi:hypothetical protein